MSERARIEAEILAAEAQMDLGEDIDYEHPTSDDLEELWYLRSIAKRFLDAAYIVRRRYDEAIAQLLGPGGAARFGDEFLRYSKQRQWELTDGGRAWLETLTTEQVLRVVSKATKFRKLGLEAVAGELGLKLETLEGTLYVDAAEHDEPTLTTMPVGHERAPKYAAKMRPGEVRRKR